MKSKILDLLKASENPVSGQDLGEKLGVTRVGIWKHIQGLRSLGYNIRSSSKGYVLKDEPDAPFPWEIDPGLAEVHYYPEVSSTMEKARDLARGDCPHFTVVVAGRQRKGRGRMQRAWSSWDGGLYFTVVLRPSLPVQLCYRINFSASSILADTLNRLYHIDAKVKWPNDVLVGEKKISGMLSEMETKSDELSFVNLGIGVNVNNEPDASLAPDAVSIRSLIGEPASRKQLLTGFLSEFKGRIGELGTVNPVTEWKKQSLTPGRSVTVVTHKEQVHGIATDIDDDGSLVVETPEGEVRRIIYGDCFHE